MTTAGIVELIKNLMIVVSSLTVGFTALFKKAAPKAEPLAFSVPFGGAITALAYFATQPVPQGLAGWCVFALVILGGALAPSGLFAAGADIARKAAVSFAEAMKK